MKLGLVVFEFLVGLFVLVFCFRSVIRFVKVLIWFGLRLEVSCFIVLGCSVGGNGLVGFCVRVGIELEKMVRIS